jgi:hypothetical protein
MDNKTIVLLAIIVAATICYCFTIWVENGK